MELKDKIAVVTGGATGIGRALCRRFAREGARVIVADLDEPGATEVAESIEGLAVKTDVSREADVIQLVARATEQFGRVDLFCSNAGIALDGGPEASDDGWERIWKINVMAHIYAARAVLPQMLERGDGYLLQTASAAGLLTQVGSAPYSVTKHAAVAFAEWLSITYGDQGIKVSCLCPQGVRTNMLEQARGGAFLRDGALDPDRVA
ncbi:MAG TPA: SDR family oxidoreductase, partial [Blastocatellia bacterium]